MHASVKMWTAAPSPRVADSPMDPTDPILDPLVHLSYVAAVTQRLELGTAVVILPQRNPLVLAKQAASLDVLSGDRLLLGIGAGYLEPEMRAVGVPMAGRGRRTDEYIDAMTTLWTDPSPAYDGRFGSGTLHDLPRHLAALRQAANEVERPERLGRLEISYLPLDPVTVDPASAERYATLGVDRLVVYPLPLQDPSDVARFMEHHAELKEQLTP